MKREQIKKIISEYQVMCEKAGIKPSYDEMLKYIKFNDETADINTIKYNFRKELNEAIKLFEKNDLKADFRAFLKRKRRRSLTEALKLEKEELMADNTFRAYRKTTAYRNADQEGKYRMLWKYVVRNFANKVSDEESLADICMEIAMYDDSQF